MKYRSLLLFIVILFFASKPDICRAGDSTFAFKVFVGLNTNNWIAPPDSAVTWASHGGSGSMLTTYSDKGPTNSPTIKLSLEKYFFSNRIGIFINEKYNPGKIIYYDQYLNHGYPMGGLPNTYTDNETKHVITSNQFTTSLGLQIIIDHFYIAPKINISYLNFSETITTNNKYTVTDTTYNSVTNTGDIKKTKYAGYSNGAGLLIGYGFFIKKIPLFIEAQADYNKTKILSRREWNYFFGIGIKF